MWDRWVTAAPFEKACIQSETILAWVKKELKDKVIFSAQLMAEKSLMDTLDNTFDGLYQIASVMSTSSLDTIESWAASNMPKVHKMLSGLIGRVRALTKKQLHDLHDDSINSGDNNVPPSAEWTAFKTACEAAQPLYCQALWATSPIDIYKGNKNQCPTLESYFVSLGYPAGGNPFDGGAYTCDAEKVGDGKCDFLCMSEACLFDGGDCGGKDLKPNAFSPFQLESAFSTSDAYIRKGFLTNWLSATGDLHWLDTPDDYYLNSTKRRCDAPEFWTMTGWLPVEDDTENTVFQGR